MEEQKNLKKEDCPHCQISSKIIEQLKESGSNKREEYIVKKEQKEKGRMAVIRRQKIGRFLKFGVPALLFLGLIVFGGWQYGKRPVLPKGEKQKIAVFFSPTCSCCHEYVNYLKKEGFAVEEKQTQDMLSLKEKYGISSEMESCHTAVIGDYFIEGHMPIEAIKKLLEEKPDILGIALPGMPQGSPGMGGIKKEAFKIYGLSKVGEILEFMNL